MDLLAFLVDADEWRALTSAPQLLVQIQEVLEVLQVCRSRI